MREAWGEMNWASRGFAVLAGLVVGLLATWAIAGIVRGILWTVGVLP